MTNPNWIAIGISVLTLVVGSTVTLIVAALHRRQMRQIELHRADPSVPLKPPPHPFAVFLHRRIDLIIFLINFSLNLSFLIHNLNINQPLTRMGVFSIALFTGGLYFTMLLYLASRNMDSILGIIVRHLDLIEHLGDQTGDIIQVLKGLTNVVITEVAGPQEKDKKKDDAKRKRLAEG